MAKETKQIIRCHFLHFPTNQTEAKPKTETNKQKKEQKTKQYGFLITKSKWVSPSLGLKSFLKSIVPKIQAFRDRMSQRKHGGEEGVT
jgi:hypothetical protein